MRLVIISNFPTLKIFGEKLDSWWFDAAGFDVEFWDLSQIFFSSTNIEFFYSGRSDFRFIGPKHQNFTNKNDVLHMIEGLRTGDIVWQISWTLNRVRVYDNWLLNAINKKKIPIIIKEFETNPNYKGIGFFIQNLRFSVARYNFHKSQPNLYIGCGSVARLRASKVISNSKFVSIPSPNILWDFVKPEFDGDYIVYVDESIEHDPDALMFNLKLCKDINGYYNRINKVFDMIESQFKIPVIVAASGKYFYENNHFGDRPILYEKTLALIKHSSLVIGHCSGALYQVVADDKPLLHLTDKSFIAEKIRGIKFTNLIFNSTIIDTENLNLILKSIARDLKKSNPMNEVKEKYFCEQKVESLNYREIIKDAILSI